MRAPGAGRPTRAVRPALTRASIVAAALALIDTDGLRGLSMRRLGAELNVDPMAIYYHLPNKAALFDGVVEAVYHEIDLTDLPRHGTWRHYAELYMRRMRDVLRRHPNVLTVVSTRPVSTPVLLAALDQVLGLLTAGGLTGQQAIDMVNCLAGFTMGHVIAEVGEPVGGETIAPEDLVASLDPQTHPNIASAFAAGYAYRPDEQYELGLRAMLDGFERLFAPPT